MSKPDERDRPPPDAAATKAALEQAWKEENAEAIRLYNERIEREGLALARYRRF
jgi:antitoxin CcdA